MTEEAIKRKIKLTVGIFLGGHDVKEQKKSVKTKKEILDVATNLFIQNGYEYTTIDDILRAWGGSKGSIYYYFKSKDEILDSVIEEMILQEEKRIVGAMSKMKLTALESLQLILTTCVNVPTRNLNGLQRGIYQKGNIPLIYKIVKLHIERSIPHFEAIIRQGIDEGIFKTEFPNEIVFFALVIEEWIFKYPMLECDEKQYVDRILAYQHILELSLGLERGKLNVLSDFCKRIVEMQTD